ncbi:MAG: hypothetical protein M3680_16670 [Myxococcota bacterium]|nr:hypothetical protein [Myxococcota bacterium]
MNPDPVRSIRVASTLNARYGDLLRTSTGESVDALELKIGECQQLYPEIWRHLDEARAALAASGLAVPGFDALRATERRGQLAVSNIEGTESFDALGFALGGGAYSSSKTAEFNVEGHQKASQACRELQRALPAVDWAALDRADQAEIAAAGSLTASNWVKLATTIGGLGAVAVVMVVLYKLMS